MAATYRNARTLRLELDGALVDRDAWRRAFRPTINLEN